MKQLYKSKKKLKFVKFNLLLYLIKFAHLAIKITINISTIFK